MAHIQSMYYANDKVWTQGANRAQATFPWLYLCVARHIPRRLAVGQWHLWRSQARGVRRNAIACAEPVDLGAHGDG